MALKRAVYPGAFKRHIEVIMRVCTELTGHREYDLRFRYSPTADPGDDGCSSVKVTIQTNCTYLFATVTVYPGLLDYWKEKNYFDIGECLLHEACHLLTEPIVELFMWDVPASQKTHVRCVIERQTQRTCNALLKHLPEDWYGLRKKPIAKRNST